MYEVDFGFGPPERVRSGINNKFDGMVFLYPGEDGGKNVDLEISLDFGEVLGDGHSHMYAFILVYQIKR